MYARKLAGELGFVQLTPTKIYEDNGSRIGTDRGGVLDANAG